MEREQFSFQGVIDNFKSSMQGMPVLRLEEGSELHALRGTQNQIKKNKPGLVISIYHRKEDIIEIPHYVQSLRPDYRFYLRHHGWDESDTVLYAV